MNASQKDHYGFIRTAIVSPLHRAAFCPYCQHSERMSRRGNALATTARLRGLIMAHIRVAHPVIKQESE